MTMSEYMVSPEMLENREFEFTPYQELLISQAKLSGKMLHGEFINIGSQTMIWNLEIGGILK